MEFDLLGIAVLQLPVPPKFTIRGRTEAFDIKSLNEHHMVSVEIALSS